MRPLSPLVVALGAGLLGAVAGAKFLGSKDAGASRAPSLDSLADSQSKQDGDQWRAMVAAGGLPSNLLDGAVIVRTKLSEFRVGQLLGVDAASGMLVLSFGREQLAIPFEKVALLGASPANLFLG